MDIQKTIEEHSAWLRGEKKGARANLSRANLSDADLSDANLRGANLSGANLSDADLSDANLIRADLSGANLSRANLSRANLIRADLSGANLSGADLSDANLRGANLSGADLRGANLSRANLIRADLSGVLYDENTAFFALQCPEDGSFIGWKKCDNGVIVKLFIPEDAKRSSATTRKCRASRAVVLDVFGAAYGETTSQVPTVYRKGETVLPDWWDNDRWEECSHGIHFFITRKEAEQY